MAFTATASTAEGRSYSLGPEKIQHFTVTVLASDTSGTITANRLSSARRVMLSGAIAHTAAPTFSGNVATLTIQPAAPVTYTCSCDSGAATVGAIYADTAGNLFSVGATIAAAVAITLKGVKPPTAGTLTKIAGTGDATLTTVAVTTAPTLYADVIVFGI